ncbi:PaaI family thioesterase [Desulfopila sp. IMCC35006]|uniref:PaaI family thioesterase n=1 Tax=Desulfopila sp. IMCC35006 TaxID=2569542 RepID=UPI0010AD2A96|nr:PaaI family thioesterase [Desulfopila sp. IMCC35006]TKB27144.1 PaaI family thioesterase [Desulfopila sp. IMCC35006]
MQLELTQERLDFLEKDFRRGFIEFCGFEVLKAGKGIFASTLKIGDNHKTQDNFIHAGVIATMSDHTAGYAAYTLVPDRKRILSIEFKINFLKPAYGHALRCSSEIISQGKQIIVAQSTVFDIRDTHEKMVSRSTITLMVIDAAKLETKN